MNKKGITGIVLAGGKSKRMGTEKGLIEFRGKKLIQYSIDSLAPFCDRILISTNSNSYDFLPYPKLPDIYANSGPMGGIYTGLVNSENDLNLVLSCDMPFIKADLLNDLILNSEGKDIVVPWYRDKHFEPMCALYHKNVEAIFFDFIQRKNFRIPDTFKVANTCKFEINPDLKYFSDDLFFNVNSREELAQIQRKFDLNDE
jgi:molybdenum cofactor guanylyltransferase